VFAVDLITKSFEVLLKMHSLLNCKLDILRICCFRQFSVALCTCCFCWL